MTSSLRADSITNWLSLIYLTFFSDRSDSGARIKTWHDTIPSSILYETRFELVTLQLNCESSLLPPTSDERYKNVLHEDAHECAEAPRYGGRACPRPRRDLVVTDGADNVHGLVREVAGHDGRGWSRNHRIFERSHV